MNTDLNSGTTGKIRSLSRFFGGLLKMRAADLPFVAALLAVLTIAPLIVFTVLAQAGTLVIITGPSVADGSITENSATVSWVTNVASTTIVQFGTTPAMDQIYRKIVPMEETEITEIAHNMSLYGLKPGVMYYYKVKSSGPDGATVESGQYTFLTRGEPPVTVVPLQGVKVTAPAAGQVFGAGPVDLAAETSGPATAVDFRVSGTASSTLKGLSAGAGNWEATAGPLEPGEYSVIATASGQDVSGAAVTRTSAAVDFIIPVSEPAKPPVEPAKPPVEPAKPPVEPAGPPEPVLISEPPAPPEELPVPAGPDLNCADSDGGLNSASRGVVAFGGQEFADACADAASVIEQYCDAGSQRSQTVVCEGGGSCLDGACVAASYNPFQTSCGDGICDGGENSGSCVQDCPATPLAGPPEPSGALVPDDQRLSPDALDFSATSGGVDLGGGDGSLGLFPSMSFLIYLPDGSIIKPIDGAYATLGGLSYELQPTASYEARIPTPPEPGKYQMTILINYQDDTHDIVSYDINVVAFGQVFETAGGTRRSVEGARVTLLVDDGGGNFGVYDGSGSKQFNPQVAGATGSYRFIVNPGSYKLVAEKEGYRTKETMAFPVTGQSIVSRDLELIAAPSETLGQEVDDIMAAGGSFGSKAAGVAGAVGKRAAVAARVAADNVKEFADNPYVEESTRTTAAPAATAVAVVNVASLGATTATGVPYLMYLYTLLSHPLMLIARRRRKKWGVVFNSLTRLPVDLATVRLLDAKTGRPLRMAVTDHAGRYVFIVPPGQYKLSAVRSGHMFPTVFLRGQKDAQTYVDLYHDETLDIRSDTALTMNIPVDPVVVEKTPRQIILAGVVRRLQSGVGAASILFMVGAVLITPHPVVIALLLANIATFLVFRRLSVTRRPKSWGVVFDEKTKKPIGKALARIFETRFNKLLETQITDAKGHYAFLVGRNHYYVTFEKAGYQKQQKGPLDLTDEKKAKEAVVELDVGLPPGGGTTDPPAKADQE